MGKYTSSEVWHKKAANGIEYLEFKCLNELGVKNAIFLRHGGVSRGIYASLNLRLASSDTRENLMENMNRVSEVLGVSDNLICKASQAHTDRVIHITKDNMASYSYLAKNTEQADAYLVNEHKIYTMITTADCVPIIMYDTKNKVLVNIHSGWKGTLKQIYLKALDKLETEFGTSAKDIVVCLGPAISKCCFTTHDAAFKEMFVDMWPQENKYIYDDQDGTIHIDLKYAISYDLEKRGVLKENIHNADICTKCNNDDFYSYRCTTQRKEEDYATFATIVGIE